LPDIFAVELPENWIERWPEVQQAAGKYDFNVERYGDEIVFNGYGIEGVIQINGNEATIIIDKRPFFLSSSFIEDKVREFLSSQK
jgi:hypothetical protein